MITAFLTNLRINSDATFSRIIAGGRMMAGLNQAADPNISFGAVRQLHANENELGARMIQANITRTASMAAADSMEKLAKENARKNFSIYA